jgi:hypothetical protein
MDARVTFRIPFEFPEYNHVLLQCECRSPLTAHKLAANLKA